MQGLPFYWFPSLAIIWCLGPIIGTVLITSVLGRPELIGANELAGIPVLLYSYITVSPVLIPASLLWCYIVSVYMDRKVAGSSRKAFFLFSLLSGILFGLLCAVLPVASSLVSGEFSVSLLWVMTGMATGVTCAVLCFPIWNTQRKNITAS